MPVVYLTHGGGPSYFMDMPESHPFFPISMRSENAAWLRAFRDTYRLSGENAPKAIVVVSAHWETSGRVTRVTSQQQHSKLLYDYGGFPDFTYKLKYAPPGNSALSQRIVGLLRDAGLKAETDSQWAFDHGVFVPLLMMWPEARIPVVELSIDRSYDPAYHVAVGRALASLRDEGVLLLCSGSSTHNFNPDAKKTSAFMEGLTRVVEDSSLSPEDRIRRAALEWESLPHARHAHPQEDHFVPFFVAMGAAGGEKGKIVGKVQPQGTWALASVLFDTQP